MTEVCGSWIGSPYGRGASRLYVAEFYVLTVIEVPPPDWIQVNYSVTYAVHDVAEHQILSDNRIRTELNRLLSLLDELHSLLRETNTT